MAKKATRILGNVPTGNTGSSFFVEGWYPDPEQVEADIIKLSTRLENMAEPLEESVQALIYSTSQHFYHEKDPYGEKWQELTQTYTKFKELHGRGSQKILVFDGPLKRGATARTTWDIVGDDIVFNAGMLPVNEHGQIYGIAHQAGTDEEGGG